MWLTIDFDEDWQAAFDWDDGHVETHQASVVSFDDPDYLEGRSWVKAALGAAGISNKLRPAMHLDMLARKWGVTRRTVMLNLVLDLNLYGLKFAAWKYFFAQDCRFEFLPKTGMKVSTGLVYNRKAGGFVRWHSRLGIPQDWCVQRELREMNEALLSVTVATKPQRGRKSHRSLMSDETAENKLIELLKGAANVGV